MLSLHPLWHVEQASRFFIVQVHSKNDKLYRRSLKIKTVQKILTINALYQVWKADSASAFSTYFLLPLFNKKTCKRIVYMQK